MTANKYLATLLLAASLLSVPPAYGRQRPASKHAPVVLTGTIERFDDGDTYWLKPEHGNHFKVREYTADAPELAHNSKEIDQPGGQEALKYCTEHWKGKHVTATVKGKSYDRVVAQTVADGETKAIGLVLVALGYAEVYPETRPKPSKDYLDAETSARNAKLRIWSDPSHVDPWIWRKQQREKQRSK